jgi:hypothetical protein
MSFGTVRILGKEFRGSELQLRHNRVRHSWALAPEAFRTWQQRRSRFLIGTTSELFTR